MFQSTNLRKVTSKFTLRTAVLAAAIAAALGPSIVIAQGIPKYGDADILNKEVDEATGATILTIRNPSSGKTESIYRYPNGVTGYRNSQGKVIYADKDGKLFSPSGTSDAPAAAGDGELKRHEPKSDEPKSDAPKSDAPKSDAPKSDAPKAEPKPNSPPPEDHGTQEGPRIRLPEPKPDMDHAIDEPLPPLRNSTRDANGNTFGETQKGESYARYKDGTEVIISTDRTKQKTKYADGQEGETDFRTRKEIITSQTGDKYIRSIDDPKGETSRIFPIGSNGGYQYFDSDKSKVTVAGSGEIWTEKTDGSKSYFKPADNTTTVTGSKGETVVTGPGGKVVEQLGPPDAEGNRLWEKPGTTPAIIGPGKNGLDEIKAYNPPDLNKPGSSFLTRPTDGKVIGIIDSAQIKQIPPGQKIFDIGRGEYQKWYQQRADEKAQEAARKRSDLEQFRQSLEQQAATNRPPSESDLSRFTREISALQQLEAIAAAINKVVADDQAKGSGGTDPADATDPDAKKPPEETPVPLEDLVAKETERAAIDAQEQALAQEEAQMAAENQALESESAEVAREYERNNDDYKKVSAFLDDFGIEENSIKLEEILLDSEDFNIKRLENSVDFDLYDACPNGAPYFSCTHPEHKDEWYRRQLGQNFVDRRNAFYRNLADLENRKDRLRDKKEQYKSDKEDYDRSKAQYQQAAQRYEQKRQSVENQNSAISAKRQSLNALKSSFATKYPTSP